jgi:hypothetical protein
MPWDGGPPAGGRKGPAYARRKCLRPARCGGSERANLKEVCGEPPDRRAQWQVPSDSGQPFEAPSRDSGGRSATVGGRVSALLGIAACDDVDVLCASCVSAHAPMCVFLYLCARVCARDHVCASVMCMYL